MTTSEQEEPQPQPSHDDDKPQHEMDDTDSAIATRQLIDTIRSNPILYDQKSVNFTNVPRKELIWADISREMDVDGKCLQ